MRIASGADGAVSVKLPPWAESAVAHFQLPLLASVHNLCAIDARHGNFTTNGGLGCCGRGGKATARRRLRQDGAGGEIQQGFATAAATALTVPHFCALRACGDIPVIARGCLAHLSPASSRARPPRWRLQVAHFAQSFPSVMKEHARPGDQKLFERTRRRSPDPHPIASGRTVYLLP